MRALAYDGFRQPLTLRDLPPPLAPDGGVVVAVEATGLCRSDWHGWMGHDDDIASFPHIPGHELAGTVVALGAGVPHRWLGRRVTAPFVQACGSCAVCRAGDAQVCPHQQQPGFTMPGSYAERVVVVAAESNLVELPEGLEAGRAAGLGCRVATAYRAVVGRGEVPPGQWALVIGCGGVGLAAVAVAVSRGAQVIAVDPSETALAQAVSLGARHTLCPGPGTDVPTVVQELTGGGAQVSLDCIGSADAARDGILALRRRGRHVQVGLLGHERPDVPLGRVIAWELDVLGSHGMAAADYPPMLADVAAGRLDLDALMAPGGPISLAQAAIELPAMGEQPPGGIRVIDPTLD